MSDETKQSVLGDDKEYLVTDPLFWRNRLQRNRYQQHPHRAVIDESPEFWEASNGVAKVVAESVVKFFGAEHVLDAGCGIGNCCEFFSGAARYVGIDVSPDFIELARKSYPGKDFRVIDFTNRLPFGDDEFDLVYARSVEGMLVERCGREVWERVENELRRVAKTVVVSSSLYMPFRYDLISKSGRRLHCVGPTHVHSFDKEQAQAGFPPSSEPIKEG